MQVHIKIVGPKFLFNNLTEAITKLVSVRKRYQFALHLLYIVNSFYTRALPYIVLQIQEKIRIYFHHVFDSFSQLFPFLCPRRANRSHRSSLRRSLQKNDGSDLLFSKKESLFRSFAHKKRTIRSKTQRANSQPCRAFRGRKGSNDTENIWFLLTYFRLRSSGCNVN